MKSYNRLRNSHFVFSDLLVSLFLIMILVKYNYESNLAPEYYLIIIQLGIFWFFCRIGYSLYPRLSRYICFVILLVGLIEAIWGLGQLYNLFPSKHALFKITGTFFNSGPYGGFIALMFPLALHFWIYFKQKNKRLRYVFISVGIICLLVFPATLSRTAWIAAIAGCTLVLIFDMGLIRKLENFKKKHQVKFTICVLILCLVLTGTLYGVYYLKKDSAHGRLFMWKITALAIKESPVQGVGLGGFPAAYAKAQVDYFKSGKGSETEKMVAGSPEYAFNEYLRIFLEQGSFGGILFLLLTVLVIRNGVRNKQTGAAGSFLALSVFAFGSYPYYLWEFLVMWVLLSTICVSKIDFTFFHKKQKVYMYAILCLVGLSICSFVCAQYQITYFLANKEWGKIRPLYTMKAYQSIVKDYKQLYPKLNHNQKFIFEYAITLNASEQKEKADSILSRGLQLSCDPMFYNVKGRNYHEMAKYKEAEECYLNSIHLLPGRIYPYYLLTKLYADSANYQPEKMKGAAIAVFEKEPKVHSLAINEMRDEVAKILKEREVINE